MENDSKNPMKRTKNVRSKPMYVGDLDVFPVDLIREKRVRNKRIEYLVKWTGYEECDNSWVSATEVSKDLINVFNKQSKEKAASDRSGSLKNVLNSVEPVNVTTEQTSNEWFSSAYNGSYIDDCLGDCGANVVLVSPMNEIKLFSSITESK